jgi:hypothetical protein
LSAPIMGGGLAGKCDVFHTTAWGKPRASGRCDALKLRLF